MKKTINITKQDESLFQETIGPLYLVLNKRCKILLSSQELLKEISRETTAQKLEDIFPALSHRLIIKAHAEEAHKTHRPIELSDECLLPVNKGHPYSASFIPWRHESGEELVIMGLLQETTAEHVESEFSSAFAKAINLVRECVVIVNTEGCIRSINTSMANILGGEADDHLGKEFFKTIPLCNGADFDAPVRPLENAYKHGIAVTINDHLYLKSANGPTLSVTVTARPFSRKGGGQLSGAVILIQRRRTSTVDNDSHSPFPDRSLLSIAGLAHDLANSLTGAEGCLHLLEENESDKLRGVLSAINRAKELAGRLKEFSLDGKSIRAEISVSRLIQDSISILTINPHIQARTNIPWDIGCIYGDEVQISRVLTNILKNAAEAVGSGGEINIEASNVDTVGNPAINLQPGHYICIKVTDNGPGIPEEVVPLLFKSKFTTKPNGSGLGLSISRKILDDHGGAIVVNSAPNKGATFCLYLPRSVETMEPTLFTPNFQPEENEGRILVLDDDPLIRQILRDILVRGGYEVVVTERSDHAIEAFMKAGSEKRPFDLVIFDLTLNVGKDGAETFKTIRVIEPGVKGIISTGYRVDQERLLNEYGFNASIEKPYSADDLLRTIKEVITNTDSDSLKATSNLKR